MKVRVLFPHYICRCSSLSSSQHFEEIFKRSLSVQGYICFTGPSARELPHFFDEVVPLVLQKKITVREHFYNGLESAAQALGDMHTGGNTGKAVIVVADDD